MLNLALCELQLNSCPAISSGILGWLLELVVTTCWDRQVN
jgi:hypothetical protein